MIRDQIKEQIKKAVVAEYPEVKISLEEIHLEHPQNEKWGDYATNVALTLSKQVKQPPMEIAKKICYKIQANLNELGDEFKRMIGIESAKVAPPGFINLKLSSNWLQSEIKTILERGGDYGTPEEVKSHLSTRSARSGSPLRSEKIQVEFVSANPTGPLHVGNARGGPIGDVLANVLEKAGYTVEREYLHNDVGGQVKKLGESLLYWNKIAAGGEASFPENGYRGDYVKELAEKAKKKGIENIPESLGKFAVDHFLDGALAFCHDLGIKYNQVYRESEVAAQSWTKKALEKLKKGGYLKEFEGAVWFAPSDEFLRDRECVVIKSDGEYTYFSNDIGYHLEKFSRGFEKVINIWGANHQGHVPRMKAAVLALGIDPERLQLPLYQWVSLKRGGKKLSMSKRKGDFVLAQDVLNDVGRDAFRFMFLLRGASSHLEFDLDLAKRESKENPVYYIQYANARMHSILRKWEVGGGKCEKINKVKLSLLNKPEELGLVRKLIQLPELIEDISQNFAVHQLTFYTIELADLFHKFYEKHQVLSDDKDLTQARLALIKATQIVLQNTLALLGVSAPERM